MTEDMSSISDFELIQSNDVINIEKNLNNAENVLVEEKNKLFDNEIKMEIQKLKSDHKNEIEEIKINFQQFFNEKIKEILIKNKEEKDLIENGMKILKEETKETITSFEKKIGELTIEMVKLNNLNNKQVNFVEIKNKWSKISENVECCKNNCINTNKPVGNCIEGNGFINLINEENIKYIKGKGIDNCGRVYAENSFKKPKEDSSINYSLFYFEIKCTKILEKNGLIIGLKNKNYNYISFYVYKDLIKNENSEEFKLSSFSWNNNDIFGCGLIYPPNGINELPYSFFTQNGKQIGKAVLLNDNCRSYLPFITLNGCDVETNFGNDLEVKPFIYDIKKHFLAKQFY